MDVLPERFFERVGQRYQDGDYEQCIEAQPHALVTRGHEVLVQNSAGARTGFEDRAYAEAGLDVARAKREAAGNEHYKSMLRSSCRGLMEFLGSAGLLTPPAVAIYKRANLL